jgi:NagD protein
VPDRVYGAYAFDLDGTVYLGDSLLPGARETIATLRAARRPVVFISNNPLGSRESYASKLSRLGIATTPEQIVNSSYVLVRYLAEVAPAARLFVIGEDSVRDELARAGFTLTEDAGAVDIVVACFDRTFDYAKLQIAFDAIQAGARFVATNRDAYCPTPDGGLPDCGAIIAAVEACTGRAVDEVVGKPSPIMAKTLTQHLGVAPEETLIAGDRLETDIAMGHAAGMRTAVVLTGVTTEDAALNASPAPDFILRRLDELVPVA